jgi:hyperosmotically inducible periplasmic protein
MKRNLKIIISAFGASVMAFSALAQETSSPKMAETQFDSQGITTARLDRLKDTAKASDIIGMIVKNYQDEKLGTVENLALDVESGRIVQVIISSGGFFGMDATLTPVPPGALHHEVGQKILHLDASSEKFDAAPKCDTSKWEEDTQSNRVTEVYNYYDQQPYFIDNSTGYRVTNTFANTLPRNMDGTINTAGARTMDKVNNAEIARNVEENNNNISTRNPDGSWTRTYYSTNQSLSRLGYVQKASKLMGASVNNLQDENIGKVENFIIDLSCGRIVAVIISSGGYIGMNDEFSAVPPAALRSNATNDTLQLDTSKEMLAGSPHFNGNQWPDFNQPGYAGTVYQAYNIEPYFTTDATPETDNMARNVRDRDDSTLTALDQGNSQADIDTTAQIRKEILADNGMSMNARNVKIITLDGHVTLRGPVNSEAEKRQIGEIANSIAHAGNVDNQLEVGINTTSIIN